MVLCEIFTESILGCTHRIRSPDQFAAEYDFKITCKDLIGCVTATCVSTITAITVLL